MKTKSKMTGHGSPLVAAMSRLSVGFAVEKFTSLCYTDYTHYLEMDDKFERFHIYYFNDE